MTIETELAALNVATTELLANTNSLASIKPSLAGEVAAAAQSHADAVAAAAESASSASSTRSLFNRIYLGAY